MKNEPITIYRVWNKTREEYVGKKFYLSITGAKHGIRRESQFYFYNPANYAWEKVYSSDGFEIHAYTAVYTETVD